MRQHVNPLKKELQVPLPPQDWAAIFPDTARPLIVDVGCGSGRFLMAFSRKFQHHNLLGLDIRSKVCPLALSSRCRLMGFAWQAVPMVIDGHETVEWLPACS